MERENLNICACSILDAAFGNRSLRLDLYACWQINFNHSNFTETNRAFITTLHEQTLTMVASACVSLYHTIFHLLNDSFARSLTRYHRRPLRREAALLPLPLLWEQAVVAY